MSATILMAFAQLSPLITAFVQIFAIPCIVQCLYRSDGTIWATNWFPCRWACTKTFVTCLIYYCTEGLDDTLLWRIKCLIPMVTILEGFYSTHPWDNSSAAHLKLHVLFQHKVHQPISSKRVLDGSEANSPNKLVWLGHQYDTGRNTNPPSHPLPPLDIFHYSSDII